MDPVLVNPADSVERWLTAVFPRFRAYDDGHERDLALAEFALADLVASRWLGRPRALASDAAAWPLPSTSSSVDRSRVANLAWRHLAARSHDTPACEALGDKLRQRVALDVVAPSPHRRYEAGYLSFLLAARGCPGGRSTSVVADWPRNWTVLSPTHCYELTHAVFWLTDFGERRWAAGGKVLRLSHGRVAALIAESAERYARGPDLDLALEIALAGLLFDGRFDERSSAALDRARALPTDAPPPEATLRTQRAAAHPRIVLYLLQHAIIRYKTKHLL
jgi:hypothetical protein